MPRTRQANSNIPAIAVAEAIHTTASALRRKGSGCRATGSQLQKLHALLGSSPVADERVTGRSEYERLPLPYVFRPVMSVIDASVAAVTIFTRIFLGCLRFAVWGTYTMIAWSSIPSRFF